MTARERKENRLKKRLEWAEGRKQKAEESFQNADSQIQGIEPGQPILVGHHSEGRHRRALERYDSKMRSAFEHQMMAKHHEEKASNIQRQLETFIYDDDPDAIEKLEEKLTGLNLRKERIKLINKTIRKAGGLTKIQEENKSTLLDLNITRGELSDITTARKWQGYENGYPSYALQNLNGNISRVKKRIAKLKNA